jgi:hypothetical protein
MIVLRLRGCEPRHAGNRRRARRGAKPAALFPGGQLRKGIADPAGKYAQQSVTPDAARGWFRELEAAAGVQHVEGRGWYGLRRILTDTAPRFTSNELTLNVLAGTSTEMRNTVYQDPDSLEARINAANTYEQIRTGGRVSGTTPAPTPLLLNPSIARKLATYSVEELEAAITFLDGRRRTHRTVADQESHTVGLVEKTAEVDPPVDPNTKARVHEGDPGFVSPDTATVEQGAGDGTRTRDVQLGKLAFYH